MKKSFYFIREFGGLMDRGKYGKVLGALLSIFIFIVLIYVLLLPKNQPPKVSNDLKNFPENHNTLTQIKPGLSAGSINDLYLSLRRLESVENIILVLSEEVQQGILSIPPEFSGDSDFFLIKTSDREKLLEELKTQPQIEMVSTLSNLSQSRRSDSLTLWVKIIILLIGVLLAAMTFYFIRSTARDILDSWEGELQIVKYSGLSRFSVKLPLVILGSLTGFIGSVLSILLLFALSAWSISGLWLSQQLSGLLNSTSLLITMAWSILLGIVLGFLASLSSTRVVDEQWNSQLNNNS
ncbi:hypothetical protein KGY47_00045 [Candidatus Bipolaricaulota bacterium]|nr:hypothetical protein [Candidatus Bipolaricaulota bacterium]MBS3813835.1 hypothetical protein [Candidatus Bipolaricaulota bacterium]